MNTIRLTAFLVLLFLITVIVVPMLPAIAQEQPFQQVQEQVTQQNTDNQQQQNQLQNSTVQQENSTTVVQSSTTTVIPIDSGLPQVTPGDAVKKANTIAGRIYDMAANVAPMASVVIIIAAAFLGMLVKKAMYQIIWVALGLVIILWAPFLVSLVTGLVK